MEPNQHAITIKKALKEVQTIADLQDIRATVEKLLQDKVEVELKAMHARENELRVLAGLKTRPTSVAKKRPAK